MEKFLRCFSPAQRLNLAVRIAKRLPRRKINSYGSYLENEMEKYRFSVSRLLLNSKTLTTRRCIKTLAFYVRKRVCIIHLIRIVSSAHVMLLNN